MFYVEDIRNAKSRKLDNSVITCEVKFSDEDEYLPYCATSFDDDDNGKLVYKAVISENFCKITRYTEDDRLRDVEQKNKETKSELLSIADAAITPLTAYVMSGIADNKDKELFKQWNIFRKNVESIDCSIEQIEWPDKPE